MHALRTAKLEAITTRTSKHCRMHEPALSDQFGPVHPLTSFGQRHRYGSLPNHTNPRRNGYSDGIRAREFGLKLQLSSLSAYNRPHQDQFTPVSRPSSVYHPID
jgi:hypothetical protein